MGRGFFEEAMRMFGFRREGRWSLRGLASGEWTRDRRSSRLRSRMYPISCPSQALRANHVRKGEEGERRWKEK
jgi:hypothetical protein